jgi:hypothetical protein
MLKRTRTQHLIAFFIIVLVTLLATSPILSYVDDSLSSQPVLQEQGRGNGNGNGNGNANGNGVGNGGGNENGNGNGGGNGSASQPQSSQQLSSSDDLLGCQKNNPERLDCSSLEVTGVCEGSVAVFTIRNTGEPGNGDMRAPTEYRLIVDGVVVESGMIQLVGGTTAQISWTGGGTVTLEADQQIGHPGNSHPQTTLNCGAPAEVSPTPPHISAGAYCAQDGSTVFVITNDGGDMAEPAAYVVTDAAGNLVAEGTLQLASGDGVPLSFAPELGATTLNVGGGLATATIECQAPATEEPTTPPAEHQLTLEAYCTENGYPGFIIVNVGGDMTAPVYFSVVDESGTVVDEGYLQLASGEMMVLEYNFAGVLTLMVEGQEVANLGCQPPATETVTPPAEPPTLIADAYCTAANYPAFTITNIGGDMTEALPYTVVDVDGNLIEEGTLQLGSGEYVVLEYNVSGFLTLNIGNDLYVATADCRIPSTEEPAPTEEPPPPTEEPTEEPTAEPTEDPSLPPPGCQGNNEDRLDCSSLEVTGTCVDGVAVFTITNTGEPGNGDMRAPTEYRLYVDGQLVESGQVQLLGGDSMEIRYEGGGTVRLEADQQIGHPGQSQPRTTLHCAP